LDDVRDVRSLKLDHQINQLVLAQPLQISAIHAHIDSEIGVPAKGDAETKGLAPARNTKMAVGNYKKCISGA
jgi:hypothetical protein